MGAFSLITDAERRVPRVVVVGLASCFGCQIQITNAEPYLMQIGFLSRTPRGRCVTRLGYEHLGIPMVNKAKKGIEGQIDLFSDN